MIRTNTALTNAKICFYPNCFWPFGRSRKVFASSASSITQMLRPTVTRHRFIAMATDRDSAVAEEKFWPVFVVFDVCAAALIWGADSQAYDCHHLFLIQPSILTDLCNLPYFGFKQASSVFSTKSSTRSRLHHILSAVRHCTATSRVAEVDHL